MTQLNDLDDSLINKEYFNDSMRILRAISTKFYKKVAFCSLSYKYKLDLTFDEIRKVLKESVFNTYLYIDSFIEVFGSSNHKSYSEDRKVYDVEIALGELLISISGVKTEEIE